MLYRVPSIRSHYLFVLNSLELAVGTYCVSEKLKDSYPLKISFVFYETICIQHKIERDIFKRAKNHKNERKKFRTRESLLKIAKMSTQKFR
jgi:hypothetical protein